MTARAASGPAAGSLPFRLGRARTVTLSDCPADSLSTLCGHTKASATPSGRAGRVAAVARPGPGLGGESWTPPRRRTRLGLGLGRRFPRRAGPGRRRSPGPPRPCVRRRSASPAGAAAHLKLVALPAGGPGLLRAAFAPGIDFNEPNDPACGVGRRSSDSDCHRDDRL